MRGVTVNLASGGTTEIDPRVAPNGTLARVENLRIDKDGRAVARNGYSSLGTGVLRSANAINAYDLHVMGDTLVALGAEGTVTGIRSEYQYAPTANRPWAAQALGNANTRALSLASRVRQLIADPARVTTDSLMGLSAVTSDGAFTATVTCDSTGTTWRFQVLNAAGVPTFQFQNTASAVRVLAVGNTFRTFEQTGGTISVRTYDPVGSASIGSPTSLTTGASSPPAPFDVAQYEGTTDWLIAFPTATGYTWQRYNSANVQQSTTNVTSLADAPVSICGATGETINVLNVRTTSGAELRTFNQATTLLVGPTNLDATGAVMNWVGIARRTSTTVAASFFKPAATSQLQTIVANTATHSTTGSPIGRFNCLPWSKPRALTDSGNATNVFQVIIPGSGASRSYVLMSWGVVGAFDLAMPEALISQGAGKIAHSAATQGIAAPLDLIGTRLYFAIVTFDQRDRSYRSAMATTDVLSGARRQGVTVGGNLYLAGGMTQVFDGAFWSDLGFEESPDFTLAGGILAGAKTLLGVYTVQMVYRYVFSTGATMQSAPSAPKTVTLTGAQNGLNGVVFGPFSRIVLSNISQGQGVKVFADIYCTEAGGSIPRYVGSVLVAGGAAGASGAWSDLTSDATQQTGAVLYTQGADGSVSGRLPLAVAAPGEVIAESDGKIIVGRLQSANDLQLSIESRPGESQGFINDDIYYLTNPEQVTALVTSLDSRRLVFAQDTIREVTGGGPNAAGVGEISEPAIVSSVMGAQDWRGVVSTEHGVMFQNLRGRICLLPVGGAQPVEISRGIEDVLAAYPVITSATRVEQDRLVTFTCQDTAGTDGRIVHLDLRNSGMGKSGWIGRWIVDRVAAFEAEQFPAVISEQTFVFGGRLTADSTVTFPAPQGRKLNDRVIVAFFTRGQATITQPTGYALIASPASLASGSQVLRISESILNSASRLAIDSLTFGMTGTSGGNSPGNMVARVWLVRGGDPAAATETSSTNTGPVTSAAPGILTPTWGTANTLWLSFVGSPSTFADPSFAGIPLEAIRIFRAAPAGYTNVAPQVFQVTGATNNNFEISSARANIRAASQTQSWSMGASVNAVAAALAVKPLASTGTPIRAGVEWQGRLVVCNGSDVRRLDPTAVTDDGGLQVDTLAELATMYPMGSGGAGRHTGITFVGELLGFCSLTAWCSYDDGLTYVPCRTHHLVPGNGYALGQTLRLQWTPLRRKIDGVRVRIICTSDDQGQVPATGSTRGVAWNQITNWFEDLVGPARVDYRRHF